MDLVFLTNYFNKVMSSSCNSCNHLKVVRGKKIHQFTYLP